LGVAAGDTGPHRRIVEAQSTLLIGPITASHNFTRRPLPSVSMAVYDPFAPGISAEVATLSLKQNDKTSLNLRTVDVPGSATLEVKDLPPGVRWQVARREGERVTITLEASSDAPLGSFPVSAEALVDGRWAGAPPVTLVIQPAAKVVRLSN
jgi:hypothetical protein